MGNLFKMPGADEAEANARRSESITGQLSNLVDKGISESEPYNQQIQAWLSQLMGVSPDVATMAGVGGGSSLPSWLQTPTNTSGMGFASTPDWTKPFTDSELATLQQMGAMNVNNTAKSLGNSMDSSLSRRGLSGSSAGAMMPAQLDLYKRQQLASNDANITQAGIARSDALRNETNQNALTRAGLNQSLRSEAANNFANLFSASTTPSQYLNLLNGVGQNYQGIAKNYSDIASANGQMWGSIVGAGIGAL